MTDWRLERLETHPLLRGAAFIRKTYRAPRPDWDHDHCSACWRKLAEPGSEGADGATEGYATTTAFVRGADAEWICAPCFDDFHEAMAWVVEGADTSS